MIGMLARHYALRNCPRCGEVIAQATIYEDCALHKEGAVERWINHFSGSSLWWEEYCPRCGIPTHLSEEELERELAELEAASREDEEAALQEFWEEVEG